MTSQTVSCPQCDAPLVLAAGQRHCQCAHCDSRFVIRWLDSESPQFTRFESILERGLGTISLQATEERLAELETVIAEAEDEVVAARAELAQAKSAYEAKTAEVQKVISPPQNWTYVAGLLALVAWFLVWFVLENTEWYVLLAIAILLIFVAWAFHRRWREAEAWAQGELQGVRQDVEQARADLIEASAYLEDYTLERELAQMEISQYRQVGQPPSREDAREAEA